MSTYGLREQISGKKINILKESKEKENKKMKLSPNKLNTQVIFGNKNEKKLINSELDFQKLKNTKTINNNSKQIFKKINIKIASHLIKKDLLKINPILKTEANITIKAMRTDIKNKENNIIRNKMNLNIKKNKSSIKTSEPLTNININSRNNKNKILEVKKNPFILISQPIEPMTLEMERFKKMRMSEIKNYLEKKSKQKITVNSNKKLITKNKTNITNENLKKNKIFGEEQKEKNIIYKSYKENINKINKIPNNYNIHKKSNTNKILNKKHDTPIKTDLNKTDNDINSISLRNSAISSAKEKKNNNILKTLTAKPNSSLNSVSNLKVKNKIIKNQKIKRSSFGEKKLKKKIDKNKINLNLNLFDSNLKKKINTSLNTYQRNAKKNQNMAKLLNKSQNEVRLNIITLINEGKNNELIKKKLEKIADLYNKKNIEFFFKQIKKMIIIKNVNKSKEQPLYISLKKKDKKDVTNKKHFNLIIEKLVSFILNFYKSIKINAYNKIKAFVLNIKKTEAIQKINKYLSSIIFSKKYKSFINIRFYYKKIKYKEFGIKMQKILLKKFLHSKKNIFKEILSYYNNQKKFEQMNKIINLVKKLKKHNIRKLINIFKNITEYKNKLKSTRNLFELISNKFCLVKKSSYNKIKKFISGKRKKEGFHRIKDIFTKVKMNKLRIFFFDFVNIIKKIKIYTIYEKLEKKLLSKKREIKQIIFNKFKKIYEEQIKIKNNIRKRWENNIIDNNMNIIQIDSNTNKLLDSTNNVIKKENISFNLNKKEKDTNINNHENESDNNNIIWTTSVEKWGVIYNMDDSLYEEINEN